MTGIHTSGEKHLVRRAAALTLSSRRYGRTRYRAAARDCLRLRQLGIYVRYDEFLAWLGRFRPPVHHPAGEQMDHGDPHHGRRRQARLGQAHHRRRLPTRTPAKTRSTRGASRSPRASWPTCSRPPVRIASCPSICTPPSPKASSTGRSTTCGPCRRWSTMCAPH